MTGEQEEVECSERIQVGGDLVEKLVGDGEEVWAWSLMIDGWLMLGSILVNQARTSGLGIVYDSSARNLDSAKIH